MNLHQVRFSGAKLDLPWGILQIAGVDASSFLHGQTTINVKKMEINQSKLGAVVSLAGKLEAYFLLIKSQNYFYVAIPTELLDSIVNRFEKYIIMEDVNVSKVDKSLTLLLGPAATKFSSDENVFDVQLFGEVGKLFFNRKELDFPTIDSNTLTELCVLTGFPRLGSELDLGMLLSETFLTNLAYEPDKGCFLGQETVSKIENYRGPAYFPVLMIIDQEVVVAPMQEFTCEERKGGVFRSSFRQAGKTYVYTYLFRDFRIDKNLLQIYFNGKLYNGEIHYYPYIKNNDSSKVQDLLALASTAYTKHNDFVTAKEYLIKAIEIKPDHADSYESLGVLLGHEGKFQEAIDLMDQLEKIDPKSVMAHTNKSLYLMKMGKISEAEEEKNKATLKSFSYYGDEAKTKQKLIEEKNKLEADNKRRESMFQQVLEIDAEDEMALFGMAEIQYSREQCQEAVSNLKLVLKVNPKYSVAYLLLGKCYEKVNDRVLALETYQTGVKVAAAKGDMMPANEMQSRLTKLKV